MDDKPKKMNDPEQTEVAILEDENRQTDNFVSEWAFHSADDTAEFFPES